MRDFTVDCNWPELSATATAGAGGEANSAVGAIYIFGSNNLVEDVKSINSYGSLANLNESFAIGLAAPLGTTPSTGNVIRFCHAESPKGNYGAPFALHGCANSGAYGNYAIGLNDGRADGFSSGGVNGANLTNCQIFNNTFIDCMGAFYSDTGSFDTVKVFNNTVVRGWVGVAFDSALPKQNIEIFGNSCSVQNRIGVNANPPPPVSQSPFLRVGDSYGIAVGNGATINLSVSNNVLAFDSSEGFGGPLSKSWGIVAGPVAGAIIANNTVESPNNAVLGTGVTFFNNRTPNGSPAPGL